MAATPRKFQEKIALINERAAKGTADYEEIMQQVSSLRNQQTRPPCYPYDYTQQGAVSDLLNLTQMYPGSGSSSSGDQATISRQNPSISNSAIHSSVSHRHLTPPDVLSRSSSDSSLHQTAFQNKIANYRKGYIADDKHRISQIGIINYDLNPSEVITQSVDTSMYNPVNRSTTIPIPMLAGNVCNGGPGAGPGGGGSLPDLTQVQYMPNPVPTPVDAINQNCFSGGMTSISTGIFPRSNGPYASRSSSSRGASPGPSPRPSPGIDRKQKKKPYTHHVNNFSQKITKSCLSVPFNAHLHMSKGIVINHSISPTVDPNVIKSGLGIYPCPSSPAGSHPSSPISVPLMDYRNPVASPQNSPCASPVPSLIPPQTGPLTQYRCSSPDSRGSAPPSPVSLQHSSSPASSPGATLAKTPFLYDNNSSQNQTTNQLNHQFQQITVHGDQLEAVARVPSNENSYYSTVGCTSPSSGNGISSIPIIYPSPIIISQNSPSQPLSTSPVTPSPSHSPVSPAGGTSPLSQQPATPQTPQTPSVPLPRLIVTDQDGNDDQNLLSEVTEMSSFLFDDSIFQNLSSLAEDELMSVDQIVVVDTETEESFRRDLCDSGSQQELMTLGEMQHNQFLPSQNSLQSTTATGCQTTSMQAQPLLSSINIPCGMDSRSPMSHQQHVMNSSFTIDPSMLLNSADEMTIIESLTACTTSAETEAILSQIQGGGLTHSNDFVAQLDLSIGNPSTVGWPPQMSETSPQL